MLSIVKPAIVPWFHLRLPSCGPGIESQELHLRFFQFVIDLWCEKDENKRKKAGIGPYFFKKIYSKAQEALKLWSYFWRLFDDFQSTF